MFYPEELVEQIREKNDIVDVISSYISLKKSGSNYMGLCPFHNEKSPSFSVSQTKQMYHCFGCGVGGNIYTFIMEYENYTFVEAIEHLASKAGIELPKGEMSNEDKQKANKKQILLDIYKHTATYYFYQLYNSNKGKMAYEYLTDRKLSETTIKRFGLGYSDGGSNLYRFLKNKGFNDDILNESGLFGHDEKRGFYDKFWNRVMFPIMDINSKVIGFGGRVMGDGKPKYLNSPETMLFDKSRNLFGINIARTSKKEGFILCEGYMDVIALHQAGFDNAVASLGTAFTGLQANLLKRYTEVVYLSYDSDEAGTKAALRAIPIIKANGLKVKVINMKPYKDPDEFIKALGTDEYQKRIDEAMSGFYYEVEVMASQYDMTDPEQKTIFYNELAKKMLEFTEELERNNYTEAIADKYNIPLDNFKKLINHFGAHIVVASGDNDNSYEKSDKKQKKEVDIIKASQRMLLTWYIDEPELFGILKNIINASDFKEPLYNKAAKIMFEQYEQDKKVMPAKIINAFDSKEEQNEVSTLFSTNIEMTGGTDSVIQDFKELSGSDRETYLNQLVKTVKRYSIDYDIKNSLDFNVLKDLSEQKKMLLSLNIKL